jgi:hypothetical protein
LIAAIGYSTSSTLIEVKSGIEILGEKLFRAPVASVLTCCPRTSLQE